MEILNISTKTRKRGKNPNGSQRYHQVKYATLRCSRCSKIFTRRFKTEEELEAHTLCNSCNKLSSEIQGDPYYFLNKVKDLYGKEYFIEETKYLKLKDKVTMTCKIHDVSCTSRINDLLYAPKRKTTLTPLGGCLECKKILHRKRAITENLKNKSFQLYYVYFTDIKMYKLGVSSQDKLSKRLYHKPYELVWSLILPAEEASNLEHKLHIHFRPLAYQGTTKLLKDGNTELYSVNIIPTLEKLKELMSSDL